jgi:hypothetical protein
MSEAFDLFGAICERCGMSEFGAARFKALGFKRKPCSMCPDAVRRILEGKP